MRIILAIVPMFFAAFVAGNSMDESGFMCFEPVPMDLRVTSLVKNNEYKDNMADIYDDLVKEAFYDACTAYNIPTNNYKEPKVIGKLGSKDKALYYAMTDMDWKETGLKFIMSLKNSSSLWDFLQGLESLSKDAHRILLANISEDQKSLLTSVKAVPDSCDIDNITILMKPCLHLTYLLKNKMMPAVTTTTTTTTTANPTTTLSTTTVTEATVSTTKMTEAIVNHLGSATNRSMTVKKSPACHHTVKGRIIHEIYCENVSKMLVHSCVIQLKSGEESPMMILNTRGCQLSNTLHFFKYYNGTTTAKAFLDDHYAMNCSIKMCAFDEECDFESPPRC